MLCLRTTGLTGTPGCVLGAVPLQSEPHKAMMQFEGAHCTSLEAKATPSITEPAAGTWQGLCEKRAQRLQCGKARMASRGPEVLKDQQ